MYRPSIIQNDRYHYLRDSLHYIVKSDGSIIFSSEDFSTVFNDNYYVATNNDTIYHELRKMADKNMLVNTPAGAFVTSNSRRTITMSSQYVTTWTTKHMNFRLAKDIGIVEEDLPWFPGSINTTERRLVSYHLN